jgi:BRISC and BRCA1-A complex member 1
LGKQIVKDSPAYSSRIQNFHKNIYILIFIFSPVIKFFRTNCRPCLQHGHGSAAALMNNPFFFLDIIYVHEPLVDEVKDTCQSIFNSLCTAISLPSSYVFNVSRNPTTLHDSMAKLLAHPLQRPNQQDAEYKLLPE